MNWNFIVWKPLLMVSRIGEKRQIFWKGRIKGHKRFIVSKSITVLMDLPKVCCVRVSIILLYVAHKTPPKTPHDPVKNTHLLVDDIFCQYKWVDYLKDLKILTFYFCWGGCPKKCHNVQVIYRWLLKINIRQFCSVFLSDSNVDITAKIKFLKSLIYAHEKKTVMWRW